MDSDDSLLTLFPLLPPHPPYSIWLHLNKDRLEPRICSALEWRHNGGGQDRNYNTAVKVGRFSKLEKLLKMQREATHPEMIAEQKRCNSFKQLVNWRQPPPEAAPSRGTSVTGWQDYSVLALGPCSSEPIRRAKTFVTCSCWSQLWLGLRPSLKDHRWSLGGSDERGAVTRRAFTSVVSFLKEVLWKEFLSAPCLLLCQVSPFCWPFRDGPMRSSAALLLWQREDNEQQAN